tara:strand:- start:282 stop:701 length:420 start_codon:yes stop_codon:yes gene_type:complete
MVRIVTMAMEQHAAEKTVITTPVGFGGAASPLLSPHPISFATGSNTAGGFTISSVPSKPHTTATASTVPTRSPSTGHARNALKIGFRKNIATESPTVRYVRDTYASENAIEPTTPRMAQSGHISFGPINVSNVIGFDLS